MIQNRRITDYDDMSPSAMASEDADLRQFVSFVVGEQQYCVDIMAVREIKAWTGTTALPNSPAHIRGVINLRGAIVPSSISANASDRNSLNQHRPMWW
jgi:chemotaxis signal transduction protein